MLDEPKDRQLNDEPTPDDSTSNRQWLGSNAGGAQ